ncbi:MAG: hypothetical protein JRI34_11375, partial [Deltaproteobacteria bacterium]|nr:hypothetical protein [Deltaproteobacteria bacterium]
MTPAESLPIFYRSDKKQWRQELERCVNRWDIRWTVFPYDINPELLRLLSRDPACRLTYVDHKAVIFMRDNPDVERCLDPKLAQSLTTPTMSPPESLSLPGLFGNRRTSAFERFITGFFKGQIFPTENHMLDLFHYFHGEWIKAYAHFAK